MSQQKQTINRRKFLQFASTTGTAAALAACADLEGIRLEEVVTDSVSTSGNVASDVSPKADAEVHPIEALIANFTQPSETNGDLLFFYGQVLNVNAEPIPEATVEIWHTDSVGIYNHPQDPGTDNRDQTFQFFGQTRSDTQGWYIFRTIMPGIYEPRPRHIHYKVKLEGETLLTSQFYFSEDIADVQGESMFRAVGDNGDLLLMQLVSGEGKLFAQGRIVVDMGLGSGTLPLTPSQAEGPYYPVVSLVDYDNDLTRL
ncbi:MAG: twin-arginine translocation signal domain-containing protein [Chloroflexota bacterium]